jgi:putative Mn2+ efflux pump MntP
MSLPELILIALGLSMDAFAVALCRASAYELNLRNTAVIALFFGGFQAVMPLSGGLLASSLRLHNQR